ncbi:hypothetical protein BKA80DRAFT_280893 [Phyllosticta citrichinensis]
MVKGTANLPTSASEQASEKAPPSIHPFILPGGRLPKAHRTTSDLPTSHAVNDQVTKQREAFPSLLLPPWVAAFGCHARRGWRGVAPLLGLTGLTFVGKVHMETHVAGLCGWVLRGERIGGWLVRMRTNEYIDKKATRDGEEDMIVQQPGGLVRCIQQSARQIIESSNQAKST